MRTFSFRFLSSLLVAGLSTTVTLAQQPTPAPATEKAPAKAPPPPEKLWVPEYGGSAHVMRRDDTDIYVMSKPDRPFEVMCRIVADDMAAYSDPVTGQIVIKSFSILELVDALLARARDRQIHYFFPYDALLLTEGSVGTFVRWKTQKPAEADTSSALK